MLTQLLCLALFQVPLPNQDVIERAKLDFTHIDDLPRFFAEHNARVDTELARLVKGETLEHVPYEGRRVAIHGKLRPDLVRIESAIMAVTGSFISFGESVQTELMARGFSRDDLRTLEKAITGENDRHMFLERAIDNDPFITETRKRTQHSDTELLSYLRHHDSLYSAADRQWAIQALGKLRIKAQRILISYAYEIWVPCSFFFYEEGPLTHAEISALRRSFEQGLEREEEN